MFAKASCLPERSARRRATVTISVPLAIKASRINSLDANFPVPTSNREVNSRSAILSLEGLSDIAGTILSSLYESNSLPRCRVTKFDLRLEDCVGGMSQLADAEIDLVVTSPPY